MEQAFIGPFHEVQEALVKAIEKKREKAKTLFPTDASRIVPKVTGLERNCHCEQRDSSLRFGTGCAIPEIATLPPAEVVRRAGGQVARNDRKQ